jgi:hypothetical protein
MGPYAGVDYTSTYVDARVDSNTFTMGNLIPESTLTLCQSRLYPPARDLGFGLSTLWIKTISLKCRAKPELNVVVTKMLKWSANEEEINNLYPQVIEEFKACHHY